VSLRARLVTALLGLFVAGMAVYGIATYRAFARSELARLDEQLLATLPLVERELLRSAAQDLDLAPLARGRADRRLGGAARVVVAPGTYAELRGPDGRTVTTIQAVDDRFQPDLSGLGTTAAGSLHTVPPLDGDGTWRVAVAEGPLRSTVVAAVPLASLDAALARLLTIELVAGAALLVVLAIGAFAVLRSGLRPLERIAEAARSITAGSLEQRVPVPSAETEVRQLGTALNTMLDDLEAAFHDREATEAALRRFLSDASHELRTPLTSIQGYAELFRLARDDDTVDPDLVMRRIEAESARMRTLVESLLALARLDEAGAAPLLEPVDLTVVADEACQDAATTDPDRPIHLDAPAPVVVRGDPHHLRQAVGNLVVNALHHTPTGTAVEVRVHRREGEGVVEVRDHGPGLSPDALDRAFDRFWQAEPARAGSGTGLGLAIVRAVAAQHGGTATAANAPGGGARFTLAVPAGARPADAPRTDDQLRTAGRREEPSDVP
jgi:two-component system, OmpR family, sensor kinase